MKQSSKLHLFFILLFLSSSSLIAQETITITLEVDTESVVKNRDNVLSLSGFDAVPADAIKVNDDDPTKFEILAPVGCQIIWKGIAKNGTDKVKIVTFKNEEGKKLFGDGKFRSGRFGTGNGMIKADLLTNWIEGDTEKYTLKFIIINQNKKGIRFPGILRSKLQIDPRITIRARRKGDPIIGN